jgi:hypothetical protein
VTEMDASPHVSFCLSPAGTSESSMRGRTRRHVAWGGDGGKTGRRNSTPSHPKLRLQGQVRSSRRGHAFLSYVPPPPRVTTTWRW